MDSISRYEPLGGELWNKLMSKCSPLSVEALGKSLKSLEAGTPPTPSFKLYGSTDISVVTNFLSSLRKDMYPEWMLKYEESRLEKFAPQGGHAPWKEVAEDFDLYRTRPVKVTYTSATVRKTMQKDYSYLKCSMLSLKDCFQYLLGEDKIQARAAGWNTFQLKKTDAKAQAEALRIARNGEWKDGAGYVFGRFNKKKKRIFMPMPYSSMLKQAQYFVPFLTGIQNDLRSKGERSSYTFWADKIGFDACFEIMGKLVKLRRTRKDTVLVYIQRDFEKMDTTTSTSQYEDLFIPTLDAAYHQSMPDLREAMLFTTKAPIITPSGILVGDHGTASGAEVTNGGETVCNDYYDRRIQEILEQICKVFYKLLTTQGNGDDGTSVYEIYLKDFEEFKRCYTAAADQAARECGFRTQADKWRIDLEFGLYCQNFYWVDGDGDLHWAYPAVLILNSIMNPEHEYSPKDWDKDYRDIDIIEKLDNGRNLLYYEELVEYVYKGTKYPLLGSTEQETARILSKYDKYRSLQYQTERFNRENYDISKSPTVKLILEKREQWLRR